MNAKKLVVAALSASMILTATPAFAKETAKAEPTKVSAEQQYIISLLEQVVAGDEAAVANAKVTVAELEKEVKADAYINAALVKVTAKEFALKTAQDKLAKTYADLSDAMKAIVDTYMKDGSTVASYKAAAANAASNYADKVAELKVFSTTKPADTTDAKITLGSDAATLTITVPTGVTSFEGEKTLKDIQDKMKEDNLTVKDQKFLQKVLDDHKAAIDWTNDYNALESEISKLNGKVNDANAKLATAIKTTNEFPGAVNKQAEAEWVTLHSLPYFQDIRAVEEAEGALEAAKAEYAKVVAESKIGQKYEAAKAALKAAEEKLAKDKKALADAKAGIKAGDKELVVDGSNGKKQVPNTADAE